MIDIDDDNEDDKLPKCPNPVERFLRDLPLPEDTKKYLDFFYADGIFTDKDLDLIARSSIQIFNSLVLPELKKWHKPTWVTIMDAFYKRRLSRDLR